MIDVRCIPERLNESRRDQQFVALCRVRHSESLLTGKTKPVQPIAGHIYPDHGRCCNHVTLSSLCFAVPETGRRQLFETVRRGWISLLENVVRPQDVQRCIQPRHRSWPGAVTGYL